MSPLRDAVTEAERNSATDRKEVTALRAKLKLATDERDALRDQIGLIERLEDVKVEKRTEWLTPKKPAKGHRATVSLLLTDTHLDEVVDPAQIDGLNAYNRPIAEMRLERCFSSAVKLARHYLGGVQYDGAVLFLGGDIFSGNIHEELQRTNADTLFGSLLYWIDPLSAGIRLLAKEFGKLHIAGVPGNHGRMTRKPIMKMRAADNLDWLLYRLLAREFSEDSRITWEIPTSADAFVQIYGVRYLLTHGDQFRGGSGIAGALSPLLLGTHRKTRRQITAGKPYDVMVMGHWHQTIPLIGRGLLVGGSLKGYDEYAYLGNFDYEPAQQALWITTPEHGIAFSAPVFVSDRKSEGW